MVITCPRCDTRYRLADDRIRSRGAKVTCPRCSHGFVVLKPVGYEAEAPIEAEPAPTPEPPNERPTPVDTGRIRIVTPGPRKQRVEVATIDTGSQPVVATVEEPDLVADELDFGAVGIRTWKVRRRIGITYDFSDLGTLRRYLAQGRVLPEDELSPDGESWVPIADIEDLDRHYIEVWRAARASRPQSAPKPASESVAHRSSPDVSSSSFSARSTPAAGYSRPRTPTRPKRRAPPASASPLSGSSGRRLAVAAAVGLLMIGWYLALRQAPEPPPPPVAEEPDDELDARRAQIRSDLDRQFDEIAGRVPNDPVVEPPEPTPSPEPATFLPPPRPPAVLRPPTATAQDDANARRTAAAGNWFEGGKRAMAEKNFGKAREMFARAIGKIPDEPHFWEALGESQLALGETEAAAASFRTAEELGRAAAGR